MNNCLFCKIIKREIPSKIIFENESLLVFPDISPSADVHLLIIPKEHIRDMGEIGQDHGQLLTEVYKTVTKLVEDYKLNENFYRIVVNGGRAQHIPHLHFHLLGGKWKKMV